MGIFPCGRHSFGYLCFPTRIRCGDLSGYILTTTIIPESFSFHTFLLYHRVIYGYVGCHEEGIHV